MSAILASTAQDVAHEAAPQLRRRRDGHLSLHCGASRRRKLKVWMLLRLRHGFLPLPHGVERVFVKNAIRLRIRADPALSLLSDSDAGDEFLRRFGSEAGWSLAHTGLHRVG